MATITESLGVVAKDVVYKIRNDCGDPIYVGVTSDFERRKNEHRRGYHNYKLADYIRMNNNCRIGIIPEMPYGVPRSISEEVESYFIQSRGILLSSDGFEPC